jgi:DNA polymerase IV
MPAARTVCLDLDTFFVSVERLLDPRLVGRPVIVGATGWQGVVTSASYEVRALGVRAGMPIATARRLAPQAVYLPTRHGLYGSYASQVREILLEGTDAVVTASIDEFFIDFQGTERLWRRPSDADDDAAIVRRVRELRAAISERVGLPASAGAGSTRTVAKMASKLAKPHVDPAAGGVVFVPVGSELSFAEPQPVSAFPGIGPVTTEALKNAGIHTLHQLLHLPPGPVSSRWGPLAQRVARAIDPTAAPSASRDRPAFHEHDPVGSCHGSISNERTLWDGGERSAAAVTDALRSLVDRVCWRARRRAVAARTITVKLRTSDFTTRTRSVTQAPSADERVVLSAAQTLLDQAWSRVLPVRLVGVALSNLEPLPAQLALPLADLDRPRASAAIDAVRERFGFDAVRLGTVEGSSWVG